jgi:hypothetical protein
MPTLLSTATSAQRSEMIASRRHRPAGMRKIGHSSSAWRTGEFRPERDFQRQSCERAGGGRKRSSEGVGARLGATIGEKSSAEAALASSLRPSHTAGSAARLATERRACIPGRRVSSVQHGKCSHAQIDRRSSLSIFALPAQRFRRDRLIRLAPWARPAN